MKDKRDRAPATYRDSVYRVDVGCNAPQQRLEDKRSVRVHNRLVRLKRREDHNYRRDARKKCSGLRSAMREREEPDPTPHDDEDWGSADQCLRPESLLTLDRRPIGNLPTCLYGCTFQNWLLAVDDPLRPLVAIPVPQAMLTGRIREPSGTCASCPRIFRHSSRLPEMTDPSEPIGSRAYGTQAVPEVETAALRPGLRRDCRGRKRACSVVDGRVR